jgi:general secretion pathway protein L
MLKNVWQMVKLGVVEFGLLAETIWRWWLTEIREILPVHWVGHGELIAELAGHEIIFFREMRGRRDFVANLAVRGGVSLRINSDSVLRRTLSLPVSARFKLRKILENDLDRQSPLDPRKVLFCYRILSVEHAAARLAVSLVLVRRDLVEAVLAKLQGFDLYVKNIIVDDPISRQRDRFVAPKIVSPKKTRHLNLALLLMIVTIGLLVSDVFLRLVREQILIEQLSAKAAQLELSAAHVDELRTEVESSRKRAGFLAAERRKASMAVILAEITNLLPDGTWLSNLNYDGHEIEMQGYSSNASNLIPAFETSKLFSGAAFAGPMTQGPQPNLQQFDLSVSLAGVSQ